MPRDRVAGKVAFITGAARGQGRSHAILLAEEGADIVAVDACTPIEGVSYALPGPEDLEETSRLVRAVGGRVVTARADVRSLQEMEAAVALGIDRFGPADIVVANAGITGEKGPATTISDAGWQTIVDINLTGVWHTVRAAVGPMIGAGRGGSVILTSSVAGAKALRNVSPYVAAKHGVIGLMRSLALELGVEAIRVNAVLPTTVRTPMADNPAIFKLFRPDIDEPTMEDARPSFAAMHAIDVPWVEPRDVSNAVLWLASDESRYVTGAAIPVDAGALVK